MRQLQRLQQSTHPDRPRGDCVALRIRQKNDLSLSRLGIAVDLLHHIGHGLGLDLLKLKDVPVFRVFGYSRPGVVIIRVEI